MGVNVLNCVTITVAQAAKLIGSDPEQVREAILNGTFPHGFYIKTGRRSHVYKVAKKPFLQMLGISESDYSTMVNHQ